MPKPGKRTTQKQIRRSVDMSVPEKERLYCPPPNEACEQYHYPVPLDDAGLLRYVWVQHVYRGRVVHVSVEIQVRDHALADWEVTYRVDTSHGTVHEHRFSPNADPVREVIEKIPEEHPWEFVDAWYGRALQMCEDQWRVHVERWRR